MRRRDFLSLGLKAGLVSWLGCRIDDGLLLPPLDGGDEPPASGTLLARFAHVTDTHVLDEESPARMPGTRPLVHSAWRPHEAYSTQLADGAIRAVNRIHASGRTIDFLLHTGDVTDNVQRNELDWFLTLMAGGLLDPLSGTDDRPPDQRPPAHLDPHAPFEAQGLYRTGVHGDRSTIPWYAVPGNHDVHAVGTFPIFEDAAGTLIAPLPLEWRAGVLLPLRLDPTADAAYGRITPAAPGPRPFLHVPEPITPNPDRAYFSRAEFRATLRDAAGTPPCICGHSKDSAVGDFSTQPLPGVRLVALDTTQSATQIAGGFYFDGALRRHQLDWLNRTLADANARGEVAVVATHHPSDALSPIAGTEVAGHELRDLLRSHPSVALHLCGHFHRHRVTARDTYLEIETASTLDWPQESRMIELWRDDGTAGLRARYEVFSNIAPAWSSSDPSPGPAAGEACCLPRLGDDPLAALRAEAATVARADKLGTWRQLQRDPSGADPAGRALDRAHEWSISR